MYTAILFGLISSLHCIGMCGPIVIMLPVSRSNPAKKILQILLYHCGRLTSYALLGFLFGLIGRGLYLAGFQQKLSVVMGILMIAMVLIPKKTFARYNLSGLLYQIIFRVKSALGAQFKKKTFSSLFVIGLLNGLLPCGLVYAALFGALALQNVTLSIFYMILYGLGTIPMMSAVAYIGNLFTLPVRNKVQKAIPLVTAGIGILFILRGLGLDIPFVSPASIQLFVQSTPHCR